MPCVSAFVALAASAVHTLGYISVPSVYSLSSFGFEQGGTYKIEVKDAEQHEVMLLLANSAETRKITDEISEMVCKQQDIGEIAGLNKTYGREWPENIWYGSIQKADVYSLFLVHCKNFTGFDVNVKFSNSHSLIDSRNTIIPKLGCLLAVVYAAIFAIWCKFSKKWTIFTIPLYTLFFLIPPYKCVLLCLDSYAWKLRETMEDIPHSIDCTIKLMNMLFYTAFLSAISFSLSGCNIFRSKYNFYEHFEIITASAFISCGVVFLPAAESEIKTVIVLCVMGVGLLWYLDISIVSLIVLHRVVPLIDRNVVLHSKVIRAKWFVVENYSDLVVMLITLSIMYLRNSPFVCFHCACEIALLGCAISHAWFFLISCEEPKKDVQAEGSKRSVAVCFLVEPTVRSLVALEKGGCF